MTSERYNARDSEPRWQRQWDEKAIFASKNDDPRPKYYVLEMFPTRPGASISGMSATTRWATCWRGSCAPRASTSCTRWAGTRSACRPRTPRSSAKVAPKAWTYDNIAAMKKQLRSIGLSLDWAREFATCDPSYYKHQQKMFLDMLRAGLAEREKRKTQLGSGRYDRARQRAGDRRPRLALRAPSSNSAR